MSRYPKTAYKPGSDSSVLQCQRESDKLVVVNPQLPGNVIVVHGVNDVGVSFEQVEKGLCAGLNERLGWGDMAPMQPASYRMPTPEDAKRLEPDPDAVFFKRQAQPGQHSPVIPFYWGYRAAEDNYTPGTRTDHGEAVDRWGNRLDKDFSKGGGPFGNATSTLPDMWNRGFGAGPADLVDRISKDPMRPVLKAPGRLYMVLAAQRLAALVAMIRDYDPNDVVSLVAHSQGCMLSLLAQAFLLEQGLRPADTLVLTHPPYSLVDHGYGAGATAEMFSGGEDAAMVGHYSALAGRQTLYARLQTLVNIVHGVAERRHATPAFTELDAPQHRGLVGTRWEPSEDRDNRGKVYLYFCPEDMTVALDNVQGIGWQGVPDYQKGSRLLEEHHQSAFDSLEQVPRFNHNYWCEPLKALGSSFFQRVFTARHRVPQDSGPSGQPQQVLVGAPPHDHALRIEGENAHDHVAEGTTSLRASLPQVEWPPALSGTPKAMPSERERRKGIRRITGEALRRPVPADMYAGAVTLPNQPKGAHESVDPIDAAIACTSRYGLQPLPATVIDDPRPAKRRFGGDCSDPLAPWECEQIENAMNQNKPPGEKRKVLSGFHAGAGRVRIVCIESANEARLRQQQSVAARSFHGAIFGSALNHQQVTAYDIAIGGGKAVSDPEFRAYLCAVADWRLKEPTEKEQVRLGILEWNKFLSKYGMYYEKEPPERKALIYDNCIYYSTGKLPKGVPLVPKGLPPTVVSETMRGERIAPTRTSHAKDTNPKKTTDHNSGMGRLA